MGCITSCCFQEFQDSKDDISSETVQTEQPTAQTQKQIEENINNLKNSISSTAEISSKGKIEVLGNNSSRDTNHSFNDDNISPDVKDCIPFKKKLLYIAPVDNFQKGDNECSPTYDIGLVRTLAGGKFGTVHYQKTNIINIPFKSDEGKAVIDVFSQYNTGIIQLQITGISRIENRFLYAMYLLKKEEMKSRNNGHVDELNLFHGTKKENVKSICNDNFDWRRYGDNMGNRFGKGVSFTPKPAYAVHYCGNETSKVMFLAKVLVCRAILGNGNMSIPIDEKQRFYDTSVKPNIDVVVKYGDNEFYPAYRITFVVHNINPRPPQRRY